MLGGNLHEQIGFQPWVEDQAGVQGDLLAQGLHRGQGRRKAVISVRPPADGAQRLRVHALDGGLQRLEARQGVGAGVLAFQRLAQGLQALQDQREIGIDLVHRRLRRGGGGVQDVRSLPARSQVALGGQLGIQRIEGQQLPNAGLLTGNHG